MVYALCMGKGENRTRKPLRVSNVAGLQRGNRSKENASENHSHPDSGLSLRGGPDPQPPGVGPNGSHLLDTIMVNPSPLNPLHTVSSPKKIAALFVQQDGCYSGLNFIESWPESADAREYHGPYPVVAHPPCQRWGSLAYANFARWGGEHNRPGSDGGCFASALASVRAWGGVLEHPAKTRAFSAYGIPAPSGPLWEKAPCGGWVVCVWQSAYGHMANKATWLYYHGESRPHEMRQDRPVGTHQIGYQDKRGKLLNKPTLSKREANATPVAFRDALIRLAASSPIPKHSFT